MGSICRQSDQCQLSFRVTFAAVESLSQIVISVCELWVDLNGALKVLYRGGHAGGGQVEQPQQILTLGAVRLPADKLLKVSERLQSIDPSAYSLWPLSRNAAEFSGS